MVGLKEILAQNLRENRRKLGFTQAELAEKADISTHYVAMIELARNFPSADILERLAKALNIEVYELFLVPKSAKDEIKHLHKEIVIDIKQTVAEAIEKAFAKRDNIKNDQKTQKT